jgi:hypothetical protein
MDPSPKASCSDTSGDKMLGFGQGEGEGPYEEEVQEIEFEEGQPSQENIFRMASTDQCSVMSPYLRQLDPRCQSRIDTLQDAASRHVLELRQRRSSFK